MAKKPKAKKAMPVRQVHQEEEETVKFDWTIPTPHFLKLDEARLNYWRAKLAGEDLTKPLKVWADLLHIPRKKRA